MSVEIQEVLRRSEQGVTQPYICRGENKLLYYVKGKGAAYPSLVKEWIAGSLALRLGLPIAPFSQVHVERQLYEAGRKDFLRDLGYGLLFGSEEIPNSSELSITNAQAISIELKRAIAAFDWWIMNGDRTLAELGGNPNILWTEFQGKTNILWSASDGQPVIIDHNLAFDESVTLASQLEQHIFAEALLEICNEPRLQDDYQKAFSEVLVNFEEIVNQIPTRWHYRDYAETEPTGFSLDRVYQLLSRHNDPSFWTLP